MLIGKNVPLNRNIGCTIRPIGMSKSWTVRRNEVPARPAAAKAPEMNSAAGKARIAHGDRMRPMAHISSSMLTPYSSERMSAQPISPSAISVMPMGVARMPS